MAFLTTCYAQFFTAILPSADLFAIIVVVFWCSWMQRISRYARKTNNHSFLRLFYGKPSECLHLVIPNAMRNLPKAS